MKVHALHYIRQIDVDLFVDAGDLSIARGQRSEQIVVECEIGKMIEKC